MDREIRVAITPSGVVTTLAVIAGAYFLWLLRDLILLVITAIVIASAIEPGVAFIARQRIPRFFSVILVYGIVFGSLFVIMYYFLPPIISDAASFFATAPRYLESINITEQVSSLAAQAPSHNPSTMLQSLLALKAVFTEGSAGVLKLLITFFGSIFSLVLVIVLSFYFALQDTSVDDFLRMVTPASVEEYAVDLWKRAQKKIGLWMQGQVLLSVIVGILIYLGLLIIGIPYALLISVFTAMAEIIPVFGSLIAGAVAVVVAYSDGGVALAAIVAGLYVVVNQFESNLIYPLIVKKIVGIPPLLVIVALIAGYTLAGFVGVLLSVPLAAVGLELLTDLDRRKRRLARGK